MFRKWARKAFDEIDMDKTGRVDYKEVRCSCIAECIFIPYDSCRDTQVQCSQDKVGRVDYKEVR